MLLVIIIVIVLYNTVIVRVIHFLKSYFKNVCLKNIVINIKQNKNTMEV